MIVLSGAALVLPDRILSPGTLIIDDGRIAEIRPDAPAANHPHSLFAFHGHYIVPGFIDVHVHGVDGVDSLDEGDAIGSIATRLPQYGVTAFCPTTVACAPDALRRVLDQIRRARETPPPRGARVLPAHLESNFISPEYNGAQPAECLRIPREALVGSGLSTEARVEATAQAKVDGSGLREEFSGADILAEIERAAPDVGIVTIASELDGGVDLVRWLTARGHRVSLGHSGASYDEACEAIAAGARHATHLFNRMPPLGHRNPGLAGAILQTEEIAAEIICDGVHVHPAMVRAAIAAKRPAHIMAITDATAVAGLQRGARAALGGRPIIAGDATAVLDDGTIAGSMLTMDRAFRTLAGKFGVSLVDAVTMCATTPARELGLVGHGVLARDAWADLVILDEQLTVIQTYIAGQLVYARSAESSNV
jgi:N-acetylglucosamine-6-phosphate deacetylase